MQPGSDAHHATARPSPAPSSDLAASAASEPTLADDEAVLADHARALADGIESALPGWVERCVVRILAAWGGEVTPARREEAREAGAEAAEVVGAQVRALLALPVDEQWTNPLALVRPAAAWPTEVLRRAGVPPVERDATAARLLPDDVYDLAPATFADLDPSLHEPGLVWGAAKAHVFLRRRRQEGQR